MWILLLNFLAYAFEFCQAPVTCPLPLWGLEALEDMHSKHSLSKLFSTHSKRMLAMLIVELIEPVGVVNRTNFKEK